MLHMNETIIFYYHHKCVRLRMVHHLPCTFDTNIGTCIVQRLWPHLKFFTKIYILPTLGSASLTTNHSLNLFSGSLFYLVMCVCTIALIFAFSINACLTSVDQRAVRDNCFLLNLTLSLASARAVVLRYFSKPFK